MLSDNTIGKSAYLLIETESVVELLIIVDYVPDEYCWEGALSIK